MKSLSILQFLYGICVIMLIALLTSLVFGITVGIAGFILPPVIVAALAAVAGIFVSLYPMYYGMNWACELCSSSKE
jgi:dolichyl-phosphate-mannose--protein O-mannosyl transferase